MSEHDDFDTRLLEQCLRLQGVAKPLCFDITEKLIDSAFAQEKERDDGC